jgi:hypothetical protein
MNEDINLLLENKALKKEFGLLGLDLSGVFTPTSIGNLLSTKN